MAIELAQEPAASKRLEFPQSHLAEERKHCRVWTISFQVHFRSKKRQLKKNYFLITAELVVLMVRLDLHFLSY